MQIIIRRYCIAASLVACLALPHRTALAQHNGDDRGRDDHYQNDNNGRHKGNGGHDRGDNRRDNYGRNEHDRSGHHYSQSRNNYDFHGRDFGRFSPFERQAWSGGRWEHGWHENRFAWWWVAGGAWYSYPAPVYPYPTYVAPIIVQRPPGFQGALPPTQSWYYCDSPQGYYPGVAACNGPWREVPAQSR